MACAQFFFSAVTAHVPLPVSGEGIEKGNTVSEITAGVVRMAGYPAGELFVVFFGTPPRLIPNGLSLLLSALSKAFIEIPGVPKQAQALSVEVFTTDIRDALRYILKNPVLVRILGVTMVTNVSWD